MTKILGTMVIRSFGKAQPFKLLENLTTKSINLMIFVSKQQFIKCSQPELFIKKDFSTLAVLGPHFTFKNLFIVSFQTNVSEGQQIFYFVFLFYFKDCC